MKHLLTLFLLLSLTGCFRQSIRTVDADGATGSKSGEEHSSTSFGIFYGLFPGKTKAKCPNGISRIYTGTTWYAPFVMYFTAGIIVPMSVSYTCIAAPETEPGEQPAELPNGGW